MRFRTPSRRDALARAAVGSVACAVDDACTTCGDVAVALTAVEAGDRDVRCRAEDGREQLVGVDLVGPLTVGDRVLVHAGVAISRLEVDR